MTQRLLGIAEQRWADIDGHAVGHGIGLDDLPLGRFCNFVWWFLTNGADPKEVDKFRTRLWRPPVGETVTNPKSPWSTENQNSAFSSLKSALTGAPAKSK